MISALRGFILLMAGWSFSLLGGTDSYVIIRGKIGGNFDETKVKVIDSHGQSYYLPRKAFPASFKFKQGQDFMLEVSEQDLKNVRVSKVGTL